MIQAPDYPVLEDFLYLAAFLPQIHTPPPRDALYQPDVSVYLEDFGRVGDLGFVAVEDGEIIGAVWSRLIKAYGYVDEETPELIIAVLPEHQGRGLGKSLLTHLLDLLCMRGYERVSLSVEKINPALRLYESLGFKALREDDEEVVMLREFPPEKMNDFFDTRVGIYEHHMNVNMELEEFYEMIADQLRPQRPDFRLLDLGCGTGLELERLFESYPTMQVTGIDLSEGMLEKLQEKFPGKSIKLIYGSFFEVELGSGFDFVLSTYTLHHFNEHEKAGLYQRIHAALAPDGVFVYGDFTATTLEQQELLAATAARKRLENKLDESEYYHLDQPLTAENEMGLLKAAGFSDVQMAHWWEKASIIVAKK